MLYQKWWENDSRSLDLFYDLKMIGAPLDRALLEPRWQLAAGQQRFHARGLGCFGDGSCRHGYLWRIRWDAGHLLAPRRDALRRTVRWATLMLLAACCCCQSQRSTRQLANLQQLARLQVSHSMSAAMTTSTKSSRGWTASSARRSSTCPRTCRRRWPRRTSWATCVRFKALFILFYTCFMLFLC